MFAAKRYKTSLFWINDGTAPRPYQVCRRKAEVLWLMGRWQETEPVYRRNVDWTAAEPALAVQSLNDLGWVLSLRGGGDEALELFGRAAQISERLGDKPGLACALRYSGNVFQRRGQSGEALDHYLRALELSRQAGDETGMAGTLNSIANIESLRGDHPGSLARYQQALEILERIGSDSQQAVVIGNIGVVYCEMREFGQALGMFQRAATLSATAGDKFQRAAALGNMTLLHTQLGNYSVAREMAGQRIRIAREIGDEKGLSISLNHLGIIHAALRDYGLAAGYFEQAIAIARRQGIRYFLKDFLIQLAETSIAVGDTLRAETALNEARTVAAEIGDAAGALKCRKLAADLTAFTDPGAAAAQLEALLPESSNESLTADIHAALFAISRSPEHREQAAALYRSLHRQTQAVEYAEKLVRLEA